VKTNPKVHVNNKAKWEKKPEVKESERMRGFTLDQGRGMKSRHSEMMTRGRRRKGLSYDLCCGTIAGAQDHVVLLRLGRKVREGI